MTSKYGLCIGINRYGGGNELQGCVNDAVDWHDLLADRGFEMSMLLDELATKASIVEMMRQTLVQADSGDTVVITYSGHGTWVPDADGDEADGRDEALCPVDCIETGEVLTDDELYWLFTTNRKRGVRLVFISDSCHSGTVSRFMQPLSPSSGYSTRRVRFLAPELILKSGPKLLAARAVESSAKNDRRSRSSALLLSGCADNEYSYDATFNGRANGAFTYAALQALNDMGGGTYRDWYNQIRSYLPSVDYPQTPKLDGPSDWKSWAPIL